MAMVVFGLAGVVLTALGQKLSTDTAFIVSSLSATVAFFFVAFYPTRKVSEIASKRKSKRTGSGLQ